MKHQAEPVTSDRQLAEALGDAGCSVTQSELAVWRKDGLLPPLVSHGLGTGRGKAYGWRGKDIVQQAMLVHDGLQQGMRPDSLLVRLWLSGFAVPLPRLRRAWLHKARVQTARTATFPQTPDWIAGAATGPVRLLYQAILALTEPVDDTAARHDAAAVILIEKGLRLAGFDGGADRREAENLWRLLCQTSRAQEQALIAEADDEQMLAARSYLVAACKLLRAAGGDGAFVVERMAAPIFLTVLAMLRRGQEHVLAKAMQLELADRRPQPPPVRLVHAL